MIRVLVADDEPLARTGLAMIVAETPGFAAVHTCGTGAEAIVAA